MRYCGGGPVDWLLLQVIHSQDVQIRSCVCFLQSYVQHFQCGHLPRVWLVSSPVVWDVHGQDIKVYLRSGCVRCGQDEHLHVWDCGPKLKKKIPGEGGEGSHSKWRSLCIVGTKKSYSEHNGYKPLSYFLVQNNLLKIHGFLKRVLSVCWLSGCQTSSFT